MRREREREREREKERERRREKEREIERERNSVAKSPARGHRAAGLGRFWAGLGW